MLSRGLRERKAKGKYGVSVLRGKGREVKAGRQAKIWIAALCARAHGKLAHSVGDSHALKLRLLGEANGYKGLIPWVPT